MAVNISAWSIRQPLPPLVIALAVVALGYLSFNKLPITRMPKADVPVVSVIVSQFGAAPAELEAQVTKTIEDAVAGVEGAQKINSSITDGLSITTVAFRLETDTDRALNDVKDAVTRVRANLPSTPRAKAARRTRDTGRPRPGSPARLRAHSARCQPAASREQRRPRRRAGRDWRTRPGDSYARRGKDRSRSRGNKDRAADGRRGTTGRSRPHQRHHCRAANVRSR